MTSIGDVISFRYPVKPITKATDPNPTVLVLHTNWRGQLHCVRFTHKEMSPDKQNMLRMLISPQFQKAHKASLVRTNPGIIEQFDEIIKNLGTTTITSPEDFYHKAIKPIIRPTNWHPYRRYKISLMSGERVVERYSHMPFPSEGSGAGGQVVGEDPWQKYVRTIGAGRGPRFRSPPV